MHGVIDEQTHEIDRFDLAVGSSSAAKSELTQESSIQGGPTFQQRTSDFNKESLGGFVTRKLRNLRDKRYQTQDNAKPPIKESRFKASTMNRVLPPGDKEMVKQLHKNAVLDRGERIAERRINQQRKEVGRRVTKEIENQKKQML